MSRVILKLDDSYCEWSTIVDCPVTKLLSEAAFIQHYKEEYGTNGMTGLSARMTAANKTGSSSALDTKQSCIETNRAGANEQCLTEAQIIKAYS